MGSNIGKLGITSIFLYAYLMSQNIFAEKLGRFGLDPFAMLVVDLLHEFELGVWKAVFTHLLRILYAAAPAGRLITKLNSRQVRLLQIASS
jgi:hypothetical protein